MWGMSSVSLTFGVRGTLVLQRTFEAAAAYEALITYRCQAMFAVPVMLQRILELPPDGRVRALGELRVVASCGSRCPSGMTTDFMAAFGDVLYNVYGTTEISVATIATPTDCAGRRRVSAWLPPAFASACWTTTFTSFPTG